MVLAYIPKRPSGLALICDSTLSSDRELDEREGGTHVLEYWSFGKLALGNQWRNVTRLALYQHGEDSHSLSTAQKAILAEISAPKKRSNKEKSFIAANKAERREALKAKLRELNPKLTIVLQSRGTEIKKQDADEVGEIKGARGTDVWDLVGAPDSLSEMAGTIYASSLGPVMALPNPANMDFVWGFAIRNWILGAQAFVEGKLPILSPEVKNQAYMPGPKLLQVLTRIKELADAGQPVAIDIETVPSEDLITCIGFAAGPYCASVPWDSFPVAGGNEYEPAGGMLGRRIAAAILASNAPKVTHNGIGFDLPYLARRGYPSLGPVEDTYLLHGIVYRQYRHGLQRAVAGEYLIPPWKSSHAAPGHHKGSKEAWTSNPKHLREYNSLDAWYTLRLYEALRWKAGL